MQAVGLKHKQRSELTFKFNRQQGRHGWLRLTPAYSVRLVSDILDTHPHATHVLDPFSGTSTTPLAAAYCGIPATGYELNPFLCWFGTVKCMIFTKAVLQKTRDISACIAKHLDGPLDPEPPPAIHNINRWWNTSELEFLCRLKAALSAPEVKADIHVHSLLLVAFCRLVISLSNAAFNHQSMSFKDKQNTTNKPHQLSFFPQASFQDMFLQELNFVLEGAEENPGGSVTILQGDSRNLDQLQDKQYDLLITSPPYPNRISYIRELRPYMYWLDYLHDAREAGELDWRAIGGTWGMATSRLTTWQSRKDWEYPTYFKEFLAAVRHSDNRNGLLLANYVARYFEDMWEHLKNVKRIMTCGGEVHYIVGNSVFYNNLLPVEKIYRDMFFQLGFTKPEYTIIRKRNSKKELYEFDVVGIV